MDSNRDGPSTYRDTCCAGLAQWNRSWTKKLPVCNAYWGLHSLRNASTHRAFLSLKFCKRLLSGICWSVTITTTKHVDVVATSSEIRFFVNFPRHSRRKIWILRIERCFVLLYAFNNGGFYFAFGDAFFLWFSGSGLLFFPVRYFLRFLQ